METAFRRINVKTSKDREALDVTSQINQTLPGQKLKKGFCCLFIKSVNAALTTTLLDPREVLTVASILEITTPELVRAEVSDKHHGHVTPVSSEVVASFLGPYLFVPFEENQLILGKGQGVVLVELAGLREHEIVIGYR